MPRPRCPREIAGRPPSTYFKPAGIPLRHLEEVTLAPDEWEALRLADQEGLYRAAAAARMGIARQTFDRIVRRARGKVAEALLEGKALRLEGVAAPFSPLPRSARDEPPAGVPPDAP
jgi:uncharacterized protein